MLWERSLYKTCPEKKEHSFIQKLQRVQMMTISGQDLEKTIVIDLFSQTKCCNYPNVFNEIKSVNRYLRA